MFLACESRIFTLLEELCSEVMEKKDILTSLKLRTVHPNADSTVKVLGEFDLPLKDCSSIAALEEKWKSYHMQPISSVWLVALLFLYYAREMFAIMVGCHIIG